MSNNVFIRVPAKVLSRIVDMASGHLEDIKSGIEDGTYKAGENLDLPEKLAAVEAAEALYRSSMDEKAPDPEALKIVSYSGYLKFPGAERIQVDFECPHDADEAEKDMAFFSELAQIATVDYLATGDC